MPIIMPLGVTAVMLPELDLAEQIALLNKHGVTHYSLRPRIIPPGEVGKPWGNWGNHKFDLTPARLVKEGKQIAKHLRDAGITPWGTVPGISCSDADDKLKEAFEGSQAAGAGRVRVSPVNGTGYPAGPFNYREALAKTVEGYKKAAAIAKPYGQKIVIETHSRLIAASPALALNVCQNFSPDELGTIFDIANFSTEGNYQPNLAVAVLDQYIDHCHIGATRRVAGTYDGFGFRVAESKMCSTTEGDLHLPSWIKALHEAGKHVPLMIENYAENVPGAVRFEESAVALKRVLAGM